jgi:hypothetical protein
MFSSFAVSVFTVQLGGFLLRPHGTPENLMDFKTMVRHQYVW